MRFIRAFKPSLIACRKNGTLDLLILSIVFCVVSALLAACTPEQQSAAKETIEVVATAVDYSKKSFNVWTINTADDMEHYPIRLRGIAQKLEEHARQGKSNTRIGLIGLQEVKKGMTGCLIDNTLPNGAKCLAAELSDIWGSGSADGRFAEHLGAVVGDRWTVIDKQIVTDLGWWKSGRNLLEILLEHKSTGHQLRFYVVHISPDKTGVLTKVLQGSAQERRLKQAEDIVEEVRKRVQPGELPPIIVGDFNTGVANFGTENEVKEKSTRILEEHFWRPLDHMFACDNYAPTGTPVDLIYIGKKISFPDSDGGFRPLRMLHITLVEPISVAGTEFTGKLSDAHNAEGFELFIDSRNYEPDESLPGVCAP